MKNASITMKKDKITELTEILTKNKRPTDGLMYVLIYLSAFLSVGLLLCIIGYVVVKGIGKVDFQFLFTEKSVLKGSDGILGNTVNTLYIIILTLLIATPVGVGSAVYLTEYSRPGRVVRLIEFTTETLAGIPSIIFGMFGKVFFAEVLGLGYSLLTGAFTLTLMVLPLVTRNTQEALKTVPESYRSGALGMGAGKWYMIRTIILPSAMPGIITGVILAIGRIVGESAALLFTAGSAYSIPNISMNGNVLGDVIFPLLEKYTQSGGTLTIEMYLRMTKGQYEGAFGIAVVLLIIVFLINFLAKALAAKFDVYKKEG